MKLFKLSVPLLFAAAAALSAPESKADIISLNSLLTNASFEGGAQGNGCPSNWICFGDSVSWFVGTPSSATYPENPANGLAPGTYVPDGLYAAQTPTTSTSSGSIGQMLSTQYAANNSYVLNFWIGNPMGGLFPGTVTVGLTINSLTNSPSSLCDSGRTATLVTGASSSTKSGGTPCQFSGLTSPPWGPADGDWQYYTLTYTTGASPSIGNIGIYFNVASAQSGGNGTALNLDVTGLQTPPVNAPEPGTLALFGLGLLGMGMSRMRRKTA